jgi:hypothetical protein
MAINVDWEKLRNVQKYLSENSDLTPETEITFIMILKSGSAKKSQIKFKDFLSLFWAISDNNDYVVANIVVQDKEGRILYRHREITKCNEEVPDGGNASIVTHWNTLTDDEKDTYLQILIAQINGYEL